MKYCAESSPSLALSASAFAVALFLSASAPASAEVIVLDFEGAGRPSGELDDFVFVRTYYAGGASYAFDLGVITPVGSGGPDYGVSFDELLAIVDKDAGGTGNFAHEPSPDTVAATYGSYPVVMNVAAGFDTGLALYYESNRNARVDIYDGPDAGGNWLTSLFLPTQARSCSGDPNGGLCNWTPAGVEFSGVARSVRFTVAGGSDSDFLVFDNLTLGSATPGVSGPAHAVPEPATWALMIAGFGLAGATLRRCSLDAAIA